MSIGPDHNTGDSIPVLTTSPLIMKANLAMLKINDL